MKGSSRRQDRAGWLALSCEGGGTALLVFACAGLVCLDATQALPIGRVGIAFGSGVTLSLLILALGGLSGAHVNPAVSVAAAFSGRLSWHAATRYVVAQLFGAAAAGIALRIVFPAALRNLHLGAPAVVGDTSHGVAVIVEAIVAFVWVLPLAVTHWAETRPDLAPLVVGGGHVAGILLLGSVTGATGNPALAFGPAFGSGVYGNHTIYWLGPILGAGLAVMVYLVLYRPSSALVRESRARPEALATGEYQRGICLYREGRLEEAAQAFSSAAERRPGWAEPLYYIGIIYRDFGDDVGANAFFDAALYYRERERS